MNSIIVLDSSDEECDNAKTKSSSSKEGSSVQMNNFLQRNILSKPRDVEQKKIVDVDKIKINNNNDSQLQHLLKRPFSEISSFDKSIEKPIKRLKPIQISTSVDQNWFQRQSPTMSIESDEVKNIEAIIPDKNATTSPSSKCENSKMISENSKSSISESDIGVDRVPLGAEYTALLEACREADSSADMEKLIQSKLLKYYHAVHPDFVKSRGFLKTVKTVTEEVKTFPNLVYYKLKTVVEELKIRKKSKAAVMSNEDVTTTGNKKRDEQIKKLNKALFILTKRISKLEEDDVDLNDDNSSYLQVERYKKRACEIYEKICDLTGESKHAHRLVKKPITFQGTCYPQFNRTIQAFVNRTNTFPDFFDVLRCLEHCNRQYTFNLRNDEMKKIAQDAFIKIGKLLQNRRKTDLYETVAHFTANSTDPAIADPTLNAKLSDNQKFHSKISTIIDKYAREQELAAESEKKLKLDNIEAAKNKNEEISNNKLDNEVPSCSSNTKNLEIQENGISTVIENTKINGIITDSSSDKNKKSSDPVEITQKENQKNENGIKPSLKILSVTSLNALTTTTATTSKAVDEIVISDEEDT